MKFSLLQPDSPQWPALLKTVRHDFYHLPGYAALEADRQGGQAWAVLVQEEDCFLFLPLIFRKIEIDHRSLPGFKTARDCISPYGYATALVNEPDETGRGGDFLGRAIQFLKANLSDQGVACLFMRGHPLIPIPAHTAWEDFGVMFRHGQTVWIDLTLDEEELWRQTRKTYRNIIRRLQRDSYKISFDENWERLPRFLDLYNQTLDKVKADELYYFNLDYFLRLKKALGPKISLCLVEKGEEVVAGGLFTECSGIVQYHLSGSSPEGLNKDATKLMLTYVRSWAKARGNSWFHLGGGLGGEADGLLFFKSGFSPLRGTYYTWRTVTNPAIFQAAVRAWEEKTRKKADGPEGFFPPYRAKEC